MTEQEVKEFLVYILVHHGNHSMMLTDLGKARKVFRLGLYEWKHDLLDKYFTQDKTALQSMNYRWILNPQALKLIKGE